MDKMLLSLDQDFQRISHNPSNESFSLDSQYFRETEESTNF